MQCNGLHFSPLCSAVLHSGAVTAVCSVQWSSSWAQCFAANHVVHFDTVQCAVQCCTVEQWSSSWAVAWKDSLLWGEIEPALKREGSTSRRCKASVARQVQCNIVSAIQNWQCKAVSSKCNRATEREYLVQHSDVCFWWCSHQ